MCSWSSQDAFGHLDCEVLPMSMALSVSLLAMNTLIPVDWHYHSPGQYQPCAGCIFLKPLHSRCSHTSDAWPGWQRQGRVKVSDFLVVQKQDEGSCFVTLLDCR